MWLRPPAIVLAPDIRHLTQCMRSDIVLGQFTLRGDLGIFFPGRKKLSSGIWGGPSGSNRGLVRDEFRYRYAALKLLRSPPLGCQRRRSAFLTGCGADQSIRVVGPKRWRNLAAQKPVSGRGARHRLL